MKYCFKGILQRTGWKHEIEVETNSEGIIVSIEKACKNDSKNGYALPGFYNAHSHAFQYAMAGLAENHGEGSNPDDFWSWRDAMYRLALSLDPDQIESIATMLYAELVRNGYTHVAEFHYLHHNTSGVPYMNIAEIGERLIAAARNVGIKITIIPIFYQNGGFGKPINEEQRRFYTADFDSYGALFEATREACKNYEHANVGVGIHSLRAVNTEDIMRTALDLPNNIPFHIHIAEQKREVSDCINYIGKRPVEWLLENLDVSKRFNLVHATHLQPKEISGIAHMNGNVVLCPTTEGNLGDGFFPLREFQNTGGNWSIGSDSNVCINPLEEIRLLDYGQRLLTNRRDTFTSSGARNSGNYAIEKAFLAGRRAMYVDNEEPTDYFTIGKPLDAFVLSDSHPLIESASDEHLTNTFVYSSDVTSIEGTIISGKWKSKGNRHLNFDQIWKKFIRTMAQIGIR